MASLNDEKPNAMRSFKKKRRNLLENIFHLFNISATLFLFSHSSWFPTTVHAFWKIHDAATLLLHNSFFAFLLVNAIILFLYALSTGKNNAAVSRRGDWYSEFLSVTATEGKIGSAEYTTPEKQIRQIQTPIVSRRGDSYTECLTVTAPEGKIGSAESISIYSTPEKQIDRIGRIDQIEMTPVSSGELQSSPIFEETVTAVTESTTTTRCAVNGGGEETVEEKKCYRRVQSERRVVVAPARELKRINTGLDRRWRHVENLSREEFNQAVEDFIKKQKRMLMEERIGT